MIRRQLGLVAVFFVFFLLPVPLFADYVVTEKGSVGDLRWWSGQTLTSGNTLYILGHMKNASDETVYKLYGVNTTTDEQSNIALTWEDGSPVEVSQKFIGASDSGTILLHWWEKDFYSAGTGAEVTGSLEIATGIVTPWQADPAPAVDAAASEKTGIIADLKSHYINDSSAMNGSVFLKQGVDRDGNSKLYRFNIGTRQTDTSVVAGQHSQFLSTTGDTPYVVWKDPATGNHNYGRMQSDGSVTETTGISGLKALYRSVQMGDVFLINGPDTSGQQRILRLDPALSSMTSLPFVDQDIRYDLYAINENGEYITLWWDAPTQTQKYGIISHNISVSMTGSKTVSEDVGNTTLTATLSGACSEDVEVRLGYNTGSDTAVFDVDYTGASETAITIPAGSLTGTATLSIKDDSLHEPGQHEFFTVYIKEVINGAKTGEQVVTITIRENDTDNDGLPDDWESENNVDDPDEDTDNDGLSNSDEFGQGTDPNDPDSDDDGYLDGVDTGLVEAPSELRVDDDWSQLTPGQAVSEHTIGYDAFASIQAAMDIAADNAGIRIAEGTYTETLSWTKSLDIEGEAAFTTIIDGNSAGPVITATTINDSSLSGVTLVNGNSENGGGLDNSGSSITLSNCVFADNTATARGGGIYSSNGGNLTIINCTFSNNTAGVEGGAVHFESSDTVITNTIMWGDMPDEITSSGDPVISIEYSVVQGGYGSANVIDSNPLFANAGTNDFHLLYSSPCIDSGNNAAMLPVIDFDGEDRVFGPAVDIGADEAVDTDGDGQSDYVETNIYGSLSDDPDSDDDDMPDGWEEHYGLNPLEDDSESDPDGDSLTSLDERQYGTNPIHTDTDDDGYSDGSEIHHGTDPLTAESVIPDATIIYVNDDAEGLNTGKSWEDAFTSLEDGLDSSLPGDRIFVAEGTYYPETSGLDDPREAAFTMRNGVSIYGGFAGDEISLGARNPGLNTTILSGDIGIPDDISDNSYHVIYNPDGLGLDETSVLDGFIIMQGNADGDQGNDLGGGMYNSGNSPSLSQIVFKNNTAISGGGLHTYNSDLNIENTIFETNGAGSSGGAIHVFSSSLTLRNCLIYNNRGENLGGAISSFDSSVQVLGCTITGNTSNFFGGGINSISATLMISGSILRNNSPEEINSSTDTIIVEYSNVTGGVDGDGNIDTDPLFADSDTGNFSLTPESPCIGAGNPYAAEGYYGITDITGSPRVACNIMDMGAYETQVPICFDAALADRDYSGASPDSDTCFVKTSAAETNRVSELIWMIISLCIGLCFWRVRFH